MRHIIREFMQGWHEGQRMRDPRIDTAEPIMDGRRYWRDRALKVEAELLKATTKERRVPDPDGCFGPDDWAHNRCTDDCPPHGLVEPHGVLKDTDRPIRQLTDAEMWAQGSKEIDHEEDQ